MVFDLWVQQSVTGAYICISFRTREVYRFPAPRSNEERAFAVLATRALLSTWSDLLNGPGPDVHIGYRELTKDKETAPTSAGTASSTPMGCGGGMSNEAAAAIVRREMRATLPTQEPAADNEGVSSDAARAVSPMPVDPIDSVVGEGVSTILFPPVDEEIPVDAARAPSPMPIDTVDSVQEEGVLDAEIVAVTERAYRFAPGTHESSLMGDVQR